MVCERLQSCWGCSIGFVGAPSVAAHQPTFGNNHYPISYAEKFDWHPTLDPPAWLKTQFEPAAETMWATGNATRAPRFTLDPFFDGNYVEYQVREDSSCDPLAMWDACTSYDGNLRWGRIVYNADTSETNWCEAPDTDPNGCLNVSRVALHELGHIAGLSRTDDAPAGVDKHSTEVETYTVMRLVTPVKAATGWDRDRLQRCDLIELQREYDVSPLSSTYADCVDHLQAGALSGGKIRAYATLNDPPDTVCVGDSISLAGTGLIINHADLGLIAGNPLSARVFTLKRRTIGGSFTSQGTMTVANTGIWTKSVTSSVAATDEYRADYTSTEVALSDDVSSIFAIQWKTSGCPL